MAKDKRKQGVGGKRKKSKTTRVGRKKAARLVVRELTLEDYEAVADIQRRSFPGQGPWDREHFAGQIRVFPEGQIGVELDGRLVATSSTLVVDRKSLRPHHTFREACGEGYFANHDPSGDTLYGIDIAVDPDHRGKRLARRLYDERKALCEQLNLRSMLIAGRMPNYQKHADKLTPEQYVSRVLKRRLRDPVIDAQTANGFTVQHLLRNYLPEDRESHGHAVLMEWLNPDYVALRPGRSRVIDDVRVAAVQYQMRAVGSFDEFARQCEFFVEAASDYRSDFICFPELLTTQLLSVVAVASKSNRDLVQHQQTGLCVEPTADALAQALVGAGISAESIGVGLAAEHDGRVVELLFRANALENARVTLAPDDAREAQ